MARAASRLAVSTWGSREPGMRSHRLTVGTWWPRLAAGEGSRRPLSSSTPSTRPPWMKPAWSRSRVGIVGGIGDDEAVAMLMQRVGDAAQHLREENVGGIRQHGQDRMGAAGAQIAGGEVEHVAGLANRLHDGVAGFRLDLIGARQGPADGRGRDARPPRDVADLRFAYSLVHRRQ